MTDNGNFLLDWAFPDEKYCWSSVHNYIKLIPGTWYTPTDRHTLHCYHLIFNLLSGVVETGLFIDMTDECLIGDSKGNVRVLKRTEQRLEL